MSSSSESMSNASVYLAFVCVGDLTGFGGGPVCWFLLSYILSLLKVYVQHLHVVYRKLLYMIWFFFLKWLVLMWAWLQCPYDLHISLKCLTNRYYWCLRFHLGLSNNVRCKIALSAICIIGSLPGNNFGLSAFPCDCDIENLWSISLFMPALLWHSLGFTFNLPFYSLKTCDCNGVLSGIHTCFSSLGSTPLSIWCSVCKTVHYS